MTKSFKFTRIVAQQKVKYVGKKIESVFNSESVETNTTVVFYVGMILLMLAILFG